MPYIHVKLSFSAMINRGGLNPLIYTTEKKCVSVSRTTELSQSFLPKAALIPDSSAILKVLAYLYIIMINLKNYQTTTHVFYI